MYAERLIIETNEHGFLKQKPRFTPNSRVELTALVLEKTRSLKRKPAKEITGTATLRNQYDESDIIETLLANPLPVIDGNPQPLSREEIYASRKD